MRMHVSFILKFYFRCQCNLDKKEINNNRQKSTNHFEIINHIFFYFAFLIFFFWLYAVLFVLMLVVFLCALRLSKWFNQLCWWIACNSGRSNSLFVWETQVFFFVCVRLWVDPNAESFFYISIFSIFQKYNFNFELKKNPT